MRVLVLAFVLLVASLGFSRVSVPEAVLREREASVSLGEYRKGVFTRYCSGAFVKHYVVTAGHCVEGKLSVLIQTTDGRIYQAQVLEAGQGWPVLDYAVLRSPAAYLYPSLELGNGLEQGEALYAWSGPAGLGTLLLEGIYSGRIADGPSVPDQIKGFHYTTMNATGGSSGSLILNDEGQAEAILVGGFGPDSRGMRLTGTLLVDLPYLP